MPDTPAFTITVITQGTCGAFEFFPKGGQSGAHYLLSSSWASGRLKMPQFDVAIDPIQEAGIPAAARCSVYVMAAASSESGERCGKAPGREP